METQHLLIGLITGFAVSLIVQTMRNLAGRKEKPRCRENCTCRSQE
jgi:hypothetical protein